MLRPLDMSLNPCYNGRYSQRERYLCQICSYSCLNPYFNGRYSQRHFKVNPKGYRSDVLILVLMEDTLREFGNVLKIILLSALILVLMEDTLRKLLGHHLYM